MPNTSNHGGARPGAGRKPNSTKPLSAAEHLYWGRQQLTQALPQLFAALQTLAEGATTTHERWVAAGTLTTGSGDNKEPMFPHLPADELVLVSRDTYTHKPDHKALLAIIQPFLDNIPHLPEQFPQTEELEQAEQEPTPVVGAPTPAPSPNPTPAVSPPFQGGVPRSGGVVQPELSLSPDSSSPPLEKSPRLCGSSPTPPPPQKRHESPIHYRTQAEIDADNAITPPLPLDEDLLYTIEHYTIPKLR